MQVLEVSPVTLRSVWGSRPRSESHSFRLDRSIQAKLKLRKAADLKSEILRHFGNLKARNGTKRGLSHTRTEPRPLGRGPAGSRLRLGLVLPESVGKRRDRSLAFAALIGPLRACA